MKLHPDVTNGKTIHSFNTLEERFNKIHNNKYDYSKSIYTKSRGKLIIICPGHGEFTKTPETHLVGAGCPKCSLEVSANNLRFTKEDFVSKAKQIHGNKYDYSKVDYKQNKILVTIICPVHGEFSQVPHTHTQGSGCIQCRDQKLSDNTESFIIKATKVHGTNYNYSKTIYTKSWNKVIITCPTCGDFEQTPNNHLSGKGCRKCGGYGFDQTKPTILYYLKILFEDQVLYKVGITNLTIKERFKSDMQYIQILHQVHYKVGKDAYKEEQRILKEFKQFQYIGPDILKSGNTELFSMDIFGYNQKDMVTIKNNASLDVIKQQLSTLN